MASFEPVRAILRGLDILRVISENGPISATDVSRNVKLPQPTVIRILETLMNAGYIYRLQSSVLYGLTARTLALSRGFDATSRLVQLAKPLIEDLRSEIGWPSNLATFDDGGMTIAYSNRNAYGMSIPGRLGARLPLLVTGVGIIYLAHLSKEEQAATLARLKTSNSHWDRSDDVLEGIDERLAAAKRDGYAFAEQAYLDEIYHSQIWAVAVPIIVKGKVVAGLSSLVLRTAGPPKRILAQILPALRRTSLMISDGLAADAGLLDFEPAEPGKAKRTREKAKKEKRAE